MANIANGFEENAYTFAIIHVRVNNGNTESNPSPLLESNNSCSFKFVNGWNRIILKNDLNVQRLFRVSYLLIPMPNF